MKLTIGNNLVELQTIDSTNKYAAKILKEENVNDGTVIYAIEQYAGKGQSDNVWFSDAGKNLLLSIVLFPDFLSVENIFALNKAVSLGIHDYVKTVIGNNVFIKWPNDIYIGDSKVGGVLIENVIKGSNIDSSIVGIGLNLNQDKFPDNIPNPTSLNLITGKTFDIKNELNSLCKSIDYRYEQLKSSKIRSIDKDYMNALYRYNQMAKYKAKDVFNAKIIDVNAKGQLVLEKEDGGKVCFYFKEVEYII